MSEYVMNNDILTSIRAHSGISNTPNEAVEIVWPQAERDARERGVSIEFLAAELVKATYAQHVSEARRSNKPIDFQKYCQEQLAGKESIFAKLFQRKSKVAQAVAEAAQIEADIAATRNALGASQQKVQELKSQIDSTEAELADHDDAAIEESILEASKLWHLKGKSPFNSSKVEASIAHVVEAEAVLRILNARIVWLKDLLEKESAKVEAFRKQLKDLEKQL